MPRTIQDVQQHCPKRPSLDGAIRSHLGRELRGLYGDPSEGKLPFGLARLLERAAQVIRAHTEPVDQAFVDGILDSLSSLRTFALSLTRDMNQAEDLVQDTVIKAISKQETFEPGTNLQAWLFTILRHQFLNVQRKRQREVEDTDGSYAATMISIPDQEDRIVVHELESALACLPQKQREAILLVGAEGLSYEEAARAMGVKVGTVKSRVNRARCRLAELMGLVPEDGIAGSRGASA